MPNDKKKESSINDVLNPSRSILWRDFVKISREYGYTIENKRGSVRVFFHPAGERFTVHEPHGRDRWVHKNDIKALKQSIERLEVLNEEKS